MGTVENNRWYMGPERLDYHDISDYMHCADTSERAIEIGKECLDVFAAKSLRRQALRAQKKAGSFYFACKDEEK